MLLRNNSARLITINAPMGETGYDTFYDVKPGDNPAVEVPDELCESDFVQNLLKTRDLTVEYVQPATGDDDLESLRNEALLLGIDVDKKWKAPRIRAEIDKANA
jgi:hypothetical protein